MKKLITLAITAILLITFCTVAFTIAGFAAERKDLSQMTFDDPRLDLSQYTIDDLKEMPLDELQQMVADFERIYDPYGSYARRNGGN